MKLSLSLELLALLPVSIISASLCIRKKGGDGEMTEWIKVLATTPDNLSSIPGVSHRIERQHFTLSSDLHMPTTAPYHIRQTNTSKT